MVAVASVWKKKREGLKAKRNSLFETYSKDPENFHLAREIKAIDDEIAECTLALDRPLAFDLSHDLEATGRFVILDGFEISGGGIVRAAESPDHHSFGVGCAVPRCRGGVRARHLRATWCRRHRAGVR